MKALIYVMALAVAASVAATTAEAAKKRKNVRQFATAPHESYVVRDHDGEILGQDPDPFIRLMIRKEGKIRDQQGL